MQGGKAHRGRSDYGPKGAKSVMSGNLEGDMGVPPGVKGVGIGEQKTVKQVSSHVANPTGGVPPMKKPASKPGVKD